jgi:hypothetical protein
MTGPDLDLGPLARPGRAYLGAIAAVVALLLAGLAVPALFGSTPAGKSVVTEEVPFASPTPDATGAVPQGGAPTPTGIAPSGGTASVAPGSRPQPGQGSAPGSNSGGGSTGTGVVAGSGGGGRTASDVGITATTVKLGIFLIDLGDVGKLGLNGFAGYDPEQQKGFWTAYLRDANKRGGAAGRTIVPDFYTVTATGENASATAGCKQLIETDHVFAVTNIIGVYGAPILCVTKDHKTPYLSVDGAVSSFYAQSNGLLFTVQPSTLRTQLNAAARLLDLGRLGDPAKGTAKKIGVLHEDGYLTEDNTALISYLRKKGFSVTEGVHSSSGEQNVPPQLAAAASAMCSAGDEIVFLNTNALDGANFVRNIDSHPGCTPAYVTSDFDFEQAGDSFLANMPASYFRQALAVTSSRVGEGRVGFAEPAHDAACRKVYESAPEGKPINRNSSKDYFYFQALSTCQLVANVKDGLDRAGLNPTRTSFREGLFSVGTFPNAGFSDSSFRTNKGDAPDQVRLTQAFADCGDGSGKPCWKPREAFVAAPFR